MTGTGTFAGKAWKYGSNVDTDVIIPGRYCHISDEKEIAKHCLEDLDPQFVQNVSPGDILVAEDNFGCGSSRELAPIAIRASGVSCVIANSYARIFYRNAVNIGLPIVECAEAVAGTGAGDEIEINLAAGVVKNCSRGTEWRFKQLPEFMRQIMDAGGLLPYIKRHKLESPITQR